MSDLEIGDIKTSCPTLKPNWEPFQVILKGDGVSGEFAGLTWATGGRGTEEFGQKKTPQGN